MNRSVTHVLPVLVRGGAELQLMQLAAAQRAAGMPTTVLYLRASGDLVEELRRSEVNVHRLGFRTLMDARGNDIVHGWMYHGCLLAALTRPFSGAAQVWSVRRTDPDSGGLSRSTRLVIAVSRHLASRATDRIIYNADAARKQHERAGFAPSMSAVVPNAVADASFDVSASKDRSTPTFGCLTRWNRDKGVDLLIDGWSIYRGSGGIGRLRLAGPGITAENAELARMIEDCGVSRSVDLVGPLDHVGEFYADLTVYVSPSRSEGFPNVVAEAMAAGLPVIATDVGGTADVVGTAGLLISPGSAREIAAAMREVMAPDFDRAALSAQARDRVRTEFGINRMLAATNMVYDEAIAGRSKRPRRHQRPAR